MGLPPNADTVPRTNEQVMTTRGRAVAFSQPIHHGYAEITEGLPDTTVITCYSFLDGLPFLPTIGRFSSRLASGVWPNIPYSIGEAKFLQPGGYNFGQPPTLVSTPLVWAHMIATGRYDGSNAAVVSGGNLSFDSSNFPTKIADQPVYVTTPNGADGGRAYITYPSASAPTDLSKFDLTFAAIGSQQIVEVFMEFWGYRKP